MDKRYDIIVIGAGHAGCEAAVAAARMGVHTLLITSDITKIAQMSCNPSIGGIGKGQIVREIDALGGYTGKITDVTTIQFRMLNRSKGPAMHSPRAQCDRELFTHEWRKVIECTTSLELWQESIEELIIEEGVCKGCVSKYRGKIHAKRTILTAGTFLNGLIHIGLNNWGGGRIDETPIPKLSLQLENQGLERLRFKTGTSARIDLRTVDTSILEVQEGDMESGKFSFTPNWQSSLPQRPCYLTQTNAKTQGIIERGLDQSPLYRNIIEGQGPKYCPSIEDKIRMFPHKETHPIFLEPESAWGHIVYINGLSSSLPYSIQEEAIHSIRGLEQTHIIRPGYAIEYDLFNPKQLDKTLASKQVGNLYLAGQVNGTTGYEEAAAQGLVAGINASLALQCKPALTLDRANSYIGVMIDDLTTKGVDEPYRMFTSRAENRLSIRQDNADERLIATGKAIGLINEEDYVAVENKYDRIDRAISVLRTAQIAPDAINKSLSQIGSTPLKEKTRASKLLSRPEVRIPLIVETLNLIELNSLTREEKQSVEIRIKYESYISQEAPSKRNRGTIPDIASIEGCNRVSKETIEKLKKYKPRSIKELEAIPGIRQSDIISILNI